MLAMSAGGVILGMQSQEAGTSAEESLMQGFQGTAESAADEFSKHGTKDVKVVAGKVLVGSVVDCKVVSSISVFNKNKTSTNLLME